jgi:hypothetical protein
MRCRGGHNLQVSRFSRYPAGGGNTRKSVVKGCAGRGPLLWTWKVFSDISKSIQWDVGGATTCTYYGSRHIQLRGKSAQIDHYESYTLVPCPINLKLIFRYVLACIKRFTEGITWKSGGSWDHPMGEKRCKPIVMGLALYPINLKLIFRYVLACIKRFTKGITYKSRGCWDLQLVMNSMTIGSYMIRLYCLIRENMLSILLIDQTLLYILGNIAWRS